LCFDLDCDAALPSCEGQVTQNHKWLLGEAILLTVAAPLLLFPEAVPLLSALACLGLLGAWLLGGARTGRFFPPTPLNTSLLLWAIMLLVGTLVSADPDLTLPKLTGLILGLALLRMLALGVDSPRRLRLALISFLILGVGLLALGLLTVDWRLKAPALAVALALLPPQLLQLPGTAAAGAHANQFAGALLLFVPVAAAAAYGPYLARLWRWAAAALTLLALFLLLLTQSRAGWIGAVAGGVTLVALVLWQRSPAGPARQRLIALAVATLLGGALLLTAIGPQRLRAALDEPDVGAAVGTLDTIAFRLEVWRWGTMAVGDFPLTGVGLGAFRRVVLRLYPMTVFPNPDVAHAHNIFLQVALDVGLPGLVAYLALLLGAARVLWRAADDPQSRPLANALLVALVAFHVYGLGDALAPGAKPGLLFWAILGLSLCLPLRLQSVRA
jgi:putative inorganic carbon (HCO3(-)) transporter